MLSLELVLISLNYDQAISKNNAKEVADLSWFFKVVGLE
jgi:hypothetical protein